MNGRVQFILIAFLVSTMVLTACRSTGSSSAHKGTSPDLSLEKRIINQVNQTPDSLATLPRPLFYKSESPIRVRPLSQFQEWSPPVSATAYRGRRPPHATPGSTEPKSPPPPSFRVEIEAVGGTVSGRARWGLRIHSVVADTSDLRPFSFVDLLGQQLLLRREQEWRRLYSRQDSLHEKRFVPLLMEDIQRLGRAKPMRLSVNGEYYQIPASFKRELQKLSAATPDSLAPDTVGMKERLTVYHSPETPPEVEGGPEALIGEMRYPSIAKRKGLSGWVRIGFLVERDGSTSHILLERGRHPPLIAEAVRVVKRLTFEPGSHQGKTVPTWMSLPFTFKIE